MAPRIPFHVRLTRRRAFVPLGCGRKRRFCIVMLMGAMVFLASSALAATDEETLAKATDKYLKPLNKPPAKGLCVCLGDQSFLAAKRVGWLQRARVTGGPNGSSYVALICNIPGFDFVTGKYNNTYEDCANWTLLSK